VRDSLLCCDTLPAYIHASGTLSMLGFFGLCPEFIKMEISRPRTTFRCIGTDLLELLHDALDDLSDHQLTCAVLWACRVKRPRQLPFIQRYLTARLRCLDPAAIPFLTAPRFPSDWLKLMRDFYDPAAENPQRRREFQQIWQTPYR
jgi:hypothetical protein